MRLFSGIAAVENHTGNNGNLLMLKVISKFSADIPPGVRIVVASPELVNA
jgi:hypothetical protein